MRISTACGTLGDHCDLSPYPCQNQKFNPSQTRPLTKTELCDFLRASKTTIDQYNREGMPRFFVGKQCRYIPTKVLQWLERRALPRVTPTKEAFDPRKEISR